VVSGDAGGNERFCGFNKVWTLSLRGSGMLEVDMFFSLNNEEVTSVDERF